MPRPRPQYVHPETTRHGKRIWFYRKGHGKRIRLPGPPGCEGFDEALEAAKQAYELPSDVAQTNAQTSAARLKKVIHGSVRWIFEEFQLTGEFREWAKVTQANRRAIWKKVAEQLGDDDPNSITLKVIQTAVDRRSPSSAAGFMKAMAPPMRWAARNGHIRVDPTLGIKKPVIRTNGYHTWTFAEVETYRAHWKLGTPERLRFELVYWTGLRRADAVQLGPQHRRLIEDTPMYEFLCGKTERSTGTIAYIPITPPLDDVLAHYPVTGLVYLTNADGSPMKATVLGNEMGEACKAAGVPGRLHGLRKSRATLLAEEGLTTSELMALFAWTTAKEAERYTKAAERKTLAQNAARKIRAGASATARSSHSAGVMGRKSK